MWAILALDLALVAFGLVQVMVAGPPAAGDVEEADADTLRLGLWLSNALSFVAFAAVPLAWAFGTRRVPWRGGLRRLRLDRPWVGLLLGLPLLLATYAGVVVIGLLAQAIDPELLENPVVEELGGVLTWPLVVAIALVAGVGEEILFRGLLQRWVGVVPQAVLFALLHAGYGTPIQIVAPLLLGLLWGYVVKRGWGLWAPITAHVLYDFTALSVARACAGDPGLAVCPA